MVFWLFSGVVSSKQLALCARDPGACVGNELAPWMKALDAYIDTSFVSGMPILE
jgi:hypothetical protein